MCKTCEITGEENRADEVKCNRGNSPQGTVVWW